MANEENLKMFSSEYQPEKNGRPKGSRNFKTVLREMLEALDPDPNYDWGNPLAKKLIQIAFGKRTITDKKGNEVEAEYETAEIIKSIKEMLDRMEGKSLQKSEMDVKGELTIPQAKFIVDGKIEEDKEPDKPERS